MSYEEYPLALEDVPASQIYMGKDVTKYGTIWKKSGGRKLPLQSKYDERFVIIHRGWVYYYKEKTSQKPQKKFSLKDFSSSVFIAEEEQALRPCVFKVYPKKKTESSRTWYFSTENEKEMREWMDAFRTEIDRYNFQFSPKRQSKSVPNPPFPRPPVPEVAEPRSQSMNIGQLQRPPALLHQSHTSSVLTDNTSGFESDYEPIENEEFHGSSSEWDSDDNYETPETVPQHGTHQRTGWQQPPSRAPPSPRDQQWRPIPSPKLETPMPLSPRERPVPLPPRDRNMPPFTHKPHHPAITSQFNSDQEDYLEPISTQTSASSSKQKRHSSAFVGIHQQLAHQLQAEIPKRHSTTFTNMHEHFSRQMFIPPPPEDPPRLPPKPKEMIVSPTRPPPRRTAPIFSGPSGRPLSTPGFEQPPKLPPPDLKPLSPNVLPYNKPLPAVPETGGESYPLTPPPLPPNQRPQKLDPGLHSRPHPPSKAAPLSPRGLPPVPSPQGLRHSHPMPHPVPKTEQYYSENYDEPIDPAQYDDNIIQEDQGVYDLPDQDVSYESPASENDEVQEALYEEGMPEDPPVAMKPPTPSLASKPWGNKGVIPPKLPVNKSKPDWTEKNPTGGFRAQKPANNKPPPPTLGSKPRLRSPEGVPNQDRSQNQFKTKKPEPVEKIGFERNMLKKTPDDDDSQSSTPAWRKNLRPVSAAEDLKSPPSSVNSGQKEPPPTGTKPAWGKKNTEQSESNPPWVKQPKQSGTPPGPSHLKPTFPNNDRSNPAPAGFKPPAASSKPKPAPPTMQKPPVTLKPPFQNQTLNNENTNKPAGKPWQRPGPSGGATKPGTPPKGHVPPTNPKPSEYSQNSSTPPKSEKNLSSFEQRRKMFGP